MFWIIVDYVIRKSEEIKFWWTQMPQDNKLGSDLPREIPPPLGKWPIWSSIEAFSSTISHLSTINFKTPPPSM